MDIVDKKTRSRIMSKIRATNTKPEISIRKRLFAMGFRYRLHVRSLPGCPDLVFPSKKAIIFVNGCFWHYHDCHLFKLPKTRKTWWKKKLESNRERDMKNISSLMASGWRVLTIWECAWRSPGKSRSKSLDKVATRAAGWLESKQKRKVIRGKKNVP